MNDDTLQSIGDLSRRTGLPVKTIRYYSDLGIVPPADRTPLEKRSKGSGAEANPYQSPSTVQNPTAEPGYSAAAAATGCAISGAL